MLRSPVMSLDENKALVLRYVQALNHKDLSLLDEVMAPDLVDRTRLPGQGPGLAGFKERCQGLLMVFPDIQVTVEELVAEGDKVVLIGRARGTHKGTFMRMEPTGRRLTITAFDVHRIAGGKIAEIAIRSDLFHQLGLPPADED